ERRRAGWGRGSKARGWAAPPTQVNNPKPSRPPANVETMVEVLTKLNPKRLGRRLEELAREALSCISAVASHAAPEHGLTVALWIESQGRRDVRDLARVLQSEPTGHVSTVCSPLPPALTH